MSFFSKLNSSLYIKNLNSSFASQLLVFFFLFFFVGVTCRLSPSSVKTAADGLKVLNWCGSAPAGRLKINYSVSSAKSSSVDKWRRDTSVWDRHGNMRSLFEVWKVLELKHLELFFWKFRNRLDTLVSVVTLKRYFTDLKRNQLMTIDLSQPLILVWLIKTRLALKINFSHLWLNMELEGEDLLLFFDIFQGKLEFLDVL